VLSRVASAALTFGLPLALVRLLDPHAFGTYKQFFLVAQTLLLVGQLGLTQSLYYFLPRGSAERGAYVVQVVLLLGVAGALAGAGIWAGSPLLAHWLSSPDLVGLRMPLALYSGAMLAAAPLESTLVCEGDLRKAAFAYTASDVLRAAAIVVAAAVLGHAWLFWAAAVVALLRVVSLSALLGFRVAPAAKPRWSLLRLQLAYALPFAGSSLVYVLQKYLPQYAVSASFDPATFALFAVASFHLPVIDIVYTPMSEVLMVELGRRDAKRDARGAVRDWRDSIERLAALLFPATIGCWLIGPLLIPILFTGAYVRAVPLFMLATAEIPLWIFPCDAVLRASGDTRFLFAFNAVRLLVTGVLVVAGIRLLGVPGAILAGIVSEALSCAGLLARARRHLDARLRDLLDPAALARLAIPALLAAVPALALRWVIVDRVMLLIASVPVYSAAYFAARASRRAPAPAMAVGTPGHSSR
jgi:O-antigen/teichoic acid export membrane protein